MMRTLTAVLLICSIAVFAATSVQADDESLSTTSVPLVPFNAATFFAGEWEIFRQTVSYGSYSVNYDNSLPVARWNLESENTTMNLFGRGWLNGSESEPFALKIEFHDPSSGKFQSGTDEDNLNTLFHFSFTQARSSIPVSVGMWNGAETAGHEATYIFQALHLDRFTILVTPRSGNLAQARQSTGKAPKKAVNDDDEDVSSNAGPASTGHQLLSSAELAGQDSYLFIAHRIKNEPEKTFFQKYGTMFLLGIMLLVNIYMRTKQSANSFTAKQSAARATALPATGASRLSKKGATIEEITEGDIAVGSKKDK